MSIKAFNADTLLRACFKWLRIFTENKPAVTCGLTWR